MLKVDKKNKKTEFIDFLNQIFNVQDKEFNEWLKKNAKKV